MKTIKEQKEGEIRGWELFTNFHVKANIFLNKHISLLSFIMIILIFWCSYVILRDNNIFCDTQMIAITSAMFMLGIFTGFFIAIILVDLENRGILFKNKGGRL